MKPSPPRLARPAIPRNAFALAFAFALVGALTAAGCRSECDGLTGPIELSMGTGDPSNPTLFAPLTAGSQVGLTTGNQGGQHVWVQLRARNVCPERPSVRVRAFRVQDNARVGQAIADGLRWAAVPGQPGLFASETLAVQVDDRYFCTLLEGGRLRIDATVTDGRAGGMAQGSVEVEVRGWSADSQQDLREGREQCCRDVTNTACYPDGPPAGTDAGAPRGDANAQSDATASSDASANNDASSGGG